MDLLITIFRVNFIVDTAEVFALFASILPRYFKGLSCLSQRTDIAQFNVRKLRCKTGMLMVEAVELAGLYMGYGQRR